MRSRPQAEAVAAAHRAVAVANWQWRVCSLRHKRCKPATACSVLSVGSIGERVDDAITQVLMQATSPRTGYLLATDRLASWLWQISTVRTPEFARMRSRKRRSSCISCGRSRSSFLMPALVFRALEALIGNVYRGWRCALPALQGGSERAQSRAARCANRKDAETTLRWSAVWVRVRQSLGCPTSGCLATA